MTTVVAVKKKDRIAIAADTLILWGNMKESANHIINHEKILKFEDNYLAFTGSSTFKLVVEHWLNRTRKKPKFDSVENIFDSWLVFHKQLKDEYYLRSDDDDADEFETSRMNVLIANPHGIFAINPLRSVTAYKRFTAFGSGCDFAIGAMQAVYDDESKSAEDIAGIGVGIAAEFDDGTGLPMTRYTIKVK